MSLNRLIPAASNATVPTTSGTILALKSHRSAISTMAPMTAIMKIVNSCVTLNRGAWKLVSISLRPAPKTSMLVAERFR